METDGEKIVAAIGAKQMGEEELSREFNYLFYSHPHRTWANTKWMGRPVNQSVADLWLYQEIIWDRKPDMILETGTSESGLTLYFANLLDLLGKGKVITVDFIVWDSRPSHSRICPLNGDSSSPDIAAIIMEHAKECKEVLVVLDSAHDKVHVLKELELYSPLVKSGGYLIVNDTNTEGPREAVEEFIKENPDFYPEEGFDKFYLSFNPGGYLRRR
jgi:cephalosporin hydroxylase